MLDFFNSLKIRGGITATHIVIVLFVLFIITMIWLVLAVRSLIHTKDLLMVSEMELRASSHNHEKEEPIDSFYDRVESGEKLIGIINAEINDATYYTLQTYALLKQPYPISKIDQDIKYISEEVYKGLNPDILMSKNLIFTPEHIMTMIVKYTTNTLLTSVREYNSTLNAQKITEE